MFELISKHAAVPIALLTAFFLLLQTCASRQQLDLMTQEQRPWIGVSDIDPVADPGAPTTVSAFMLILKNGGKTPAFDAKIKIKGGPGDCGQTSVPSQACDGDDCTFNGMLMLPDVPLGRRVPAIGEPGLSPGGDVCLIARVDYLDAAGAKHKTGVCIVHGQKGTRSCSQANSNYAD